MIYTAIYNINFSGTINKESSSWLLSELQKADAFNVEQVYIKMNSPGGWLEPSFEIYDFLKTYTPEVTICNTGEVSSSAIIIYLGCKNRCCFRNSIFLIHQLTQVFDKDSRFTLNELKSITNSLEAHVMNYAKILNEMTIPVNNKKLADYLLNGEITLDANMAWKTNICNCNP